MKPISSPTTLCALLGVLALSSPAQAGPKLPGPVKPLPGAGKPLPGPKPTVKPGVKPKPSSGSTSTLGKVWPPLTTFAKQRKSTKSSGSYALPSGGPYVLSSFLFRFENGDHELRNLKLRPTSDGSKIEYAYNDINSDDPFTVDFGLVGMPERTYERGSIWNQTALRGNVNAGLTKAEKAKLGDACMNGAGYVPLLTGFDFSHSQKDVQVRRLAAICATETVKQCKGPYGWYTAQDGKCSGSGHPSRNARQVVYRTAWEDAGRLDTDDIEAFFDTKRTTGGKSVQADWLYVPVTAIEECRFFYGRDTRAIADFSKGRKVAIQGFDYRFLDTDHHILEVGLQPKSGGSEQVRFRDNDTKDPFEFRVQLCSLKNDGRAPAVATVIKPIGKPQGPANVPPPSALFPKSPKGGGASGPNYADLHFRTDNASTSHARNEATASANIAGAPLLSSFFFGFENGDHKIRTIGVQPSGGSVRFALADGNGDDPFEARARYVGAEGVALTTLPLVSKDELGAPSYDCKNLVACSWIIDGEHDVPDAFVPILSGLYFQRKATDANFGKMTAGWHDNAHEGKGQFVAALTEEGGWDWRHVNSQTDRGARAPRFSGSVVLVPKSRIEKCGRKSKSWHGGKNGPKKLYDSVPMEPGKTFVLQSVSFSFGANEDHHLEHLGVEYLSSGELRVHFKDDNRDDPYNWSVSYCYLK